MVIKIIFKILIIPNKWVFQIQANYIILKKLKRKDFIYKIQNIDI